MGRRGKNQIQICKTTFCRHVFFPNEGFNDESVKKIKPIVVLLLPINSFYRFDYFWLGNTSSSNWGLDKADFGAKYADYLKILV